MLQPYVEEADAFDHDLQQLLASAGAPVSLKHLDRFWRSGGPQERAQLLAALPEWLRFQIMLRGECLPVVSEDLSYRIADLAQQGAPRDLAEHFACCAGAVGSASGPPPLEQVPQDRQRLVERLVSYTSLVTQRPAYAADRAERIADGLLAYLQRHRVTSAPAVTRSIFLQRTDFALQFRHAFTAYGVSPQNLQTTFAIDHKFPQQVLSLREWARRREKALYNLDPAGVDLQRMKPWHPDIDVTSRCLRVMPLHRLAKLPRTPSGAELSSAYLESYKNPLTVKRVIQRLTNPAHLDRELTSRGQRAVASTLEMVARILRVKNVAALVEQDMEAVRRAEDLLGQYGLRDKIQGDQIVRAIVRARSSVEILTSAGVEPRRR